MPAQNKAYAVITGVESSQPGPTVELAADAKFGVIAPDGSLVGTGTQTVSAIIGYGDSNHVIRESLTDAIQAAAGDPSLDVNFIS